MNPVYDLIIERNREHLQKVIVDNTVNMMISCYFVINIEIDLLSLCNDFPIEVNSIVSKEDFMHTIKCKLHEEVEAYFLQMGYENVSVLSKASLCDFTYKIILPFKIFDLSIKDLYKCKMQNTGTTKFHKPFLYFLKGEITSTIDRIDFKSKFYKCENNLCTDKSFLLQLSDVTYMMTETCKSFIYVVDDLCRNCSTCKCPLSESLSYRRTKKVYEYVITDRVQSVYAYSSMHIQNKDCFIGTIKRRSNGKLLFHISDAYKHDVNEIRYTLSFTGQRAKSVDDLMSHLYDVSQFIYRGMKQNIDIYDILILIMLNIFTQSDTRILIVTSDPFYVSKCAHHFFQRTNINIRIYHDVRSFASNPGLCIRSYEIANYKNIDLMFHMPMNHILDYSYEIVDPQLQIRMTHRFLDEEDHTNIQNLFVTFRKKYKRIIEPERLLHTLTSLYESILGMTNFSGQIHNFILTHFIDKLV